MIKTPFIIVKDRSNKILGEIGVGGNTTDITDKDIEFWIKHLNGMYAVIEERVYMVSL